MEKEKTILKTDLKNLFAFPVQQHLVKEGYNLTERKFFITFAGSKGYMDHIEISCEGKQITENRLYIYDILNKNGGFKKKVCNVFYSETRGVRVSLGIDSPQNFKRKVR